MTPVLELPERLDNGMAERLKDQLLSHRGIDITLDGSRVTRLGTLCVQVLLAANTLWHADRKSLVLKDASDPFVERLRHIALSPENISTGS